MGMGWMKGDVMVKVFKTKGQGLRWKKGGLKGGVHFFYTKAEIITTFESHLDKYLIEQSKQGCGIKAIDAVAKGSVCVVYIIVRCVPSNEHVNIIIHDMEHRA